MFNIGMLNPFNWSVNCGDVIPVDNDKEREDEIARLARSHKIRFIRATHSLDKMRRESVSKLCPLNNLRTCNSQCACYYAGALATKWAYDYNEYEYVPNEKIEPPRCTFGIG